MKPKLSHGLATALFLVTATTTAAADSIKLADGSRVEGEATAYDENTKTLSFRTTDGRDLQFKLEELNQRSVYQVTRSKVPEDSGSGQLQIANYARDIELFAHAVRHYGYAAKADPSLQPQVDRDMAILRQKAADYCMDHAQAAIDKKDYDKAVDWLTKIVKKLPDEPQAARAAQLLDTYVTEVHAKRDDHLEEASEDLLKGDLKQGKMYYDRMLEKNKKGLTSKAGSASERQWNAAIKDGEHALKELDKWEKKHKDSPHGETIAGYRDVVNHQIIEIRMNIASQLLTRSSYQQAMSQVNQALAIDPKSEQALAMRVRVENASSRGIGWW